MTDCPSCQLQPTGSSIQSSSTPLCTACNPYQAATYTFFKTCEPVPFSLLQNDELFLLPCPPTSSCCKEAAPDTVHNSQHSKAPLPSLPNRNNNQNISSPVAIWEARSTPQHRPGGTSVPSTLPSRPARLSNTCPKRSGPTPCPTYATPAPTQTTTQVAPDAIHGTLSALGPELDLLAAFKVPPKAAASSAAAAAPSHSLRAAVCYVGHHYLAFVLAEELGLWLCFDDADISLVSFLGYA
eukprot:1156463-Pelagomonas_calceolata.AAC.7